MHDQMASMDPKAKPALAAFRRMRGCPQNDLPKALHQSGIATLEIALHVGKHHEGDAHAHHHQHGGDEEHGAPTEPVADVATNNARSQDASQEAGEHNADVAALVGGF